MTASLTFRSGSWTPAQTKILTTCRWRRSRSQRPRWIANIIQCNVPPPRSPFSPDLILINCVNYKQEEDKTENLFQKFKEGEGGITNDVTETKLFMDIEEEQEKRKERQEVSPERDMQLMN